LKNHAIRTRAVLSVAVVSLLVTGCGGDSSPTAPTPPASAASEPTRIISVTGNLAFGNVGMGQPKELTFTIANTGNSTLTVTGMTITSGLAAVFASNFANGSAIAAGASQTVAVRFTPTAAQTYSGTVTVNGDHTSGTNTIAISGTGTASVPSGPRTQFGAGQWRVGSDIAAGRYFSDPASGCYWERQKGLSGSTGDVIANEFIGFNAMQWIVDLASSDVAFKTDPDCGTWFNSLRHGAQSSLQPGVWLVGSQITPGVYRTNASSGCYWARLSDFSGTVSGIIANDFVSGGGQILIEIRSGDVGIESDSDCGTWTRSSTAISGAGVESTSRFDIRRNLELHVQRPGLGRAVVR
jgi:HYDIN/CFA65/VesB-like, Ig-like domain